MPLFLVTAPTAEPITLGDAKLQCRVDHDRDDEFLSDLISSTRMHLEGRDGWLGRVLVTQTWDYRLDSFPSTGQAIELPLPPTQSVTSITYEDPDGVPIVWGSSNYIVSGVGGFNKATVSEASGSSWPGTATTTEPVIIRFTAGYGSPLAVPMPIRRAMLLMVEDLYDRPAESILRERAHTLLEPYRLRTF